jgi:hypothetical protein
MNLRAALVTAGLLAAVALSFWAAPGIMLPRAAAGTALQDGSDTSRFEVWIADQSDTRPGFGGQLLILEGSDLMGNAAANATPHCGSILAPRRRPCAGRRRAEIRSART